MLSPSTSSAPLLPTVPHGRNASGAGRADAQTGTLQWIARFTQWALTERRVSPSTFEAYTLDLAMLSRWASDRQQDLLELTAADLTRYVAERSGEGTNLSTLARHLCSFRRFYAFVVARGAIQLNPAVSVVVPRGVARESALLRTDALRVLLRPSRRQYPSPAAAFRAQRDHTIICMLYGTRLGISHIRLLRWADLDEDWQVVRVALRNGVRRSFILDSSLLAALRALRSGMGLPGVDLGSSDYCFPTASGLPMTRQAFCHLVRKWGSQCGVPRLVTPSALRQTGLASRP